MQDPDTTATDTTAAAATAPAATAPALTLEPLEARVFGVLIEKALTTPEQYPLSLNAIVNGCNQKSNRSPVLSVEEPEVFEALRSLREKQLAGIVRLSGSRIDRFRQSARDALGLEGPSLAVVTELLLRGPQMPGELRTRASRMAEIPTQDTLRDVLDALSARGLVRELPPAPGSRAVRYEQLLCPGLHPVEFGPDEGAAPRRARTPTAAAAPGRLEALEARVDRLEAVLRLLAERLGQSPEELEEEALGPIDEVGPIDED